MKQGCTESLVGLRALIDELYTRIAQVNPVVSITCCPPLTPPSNGSWAQPAWWIDPANSTGLASDANSGADSTHPVLTWKGGVIERYGTLSPVLRQDTTWHWMSSQADDTDPVLFFPFIAHGAKPRMTGIDGQTVVATITLGGVVAENHATPQLWNADLGAAKTAGMLLFNAARKTPGFGFTGSTSFVYSLVAGTTWAILQPLDTWLGVGGEDPDDVNTWANGDSVQVISLPKVNIVAIEPRMLDWSGNIDNAFQLDRIQVWSPDNADGLNDMSLNPLVAIGECWTRRCLLFGTEPTWNGVWGGTLLINVFASGGANGGTLGSAGRNAIWNGGYCNFAATTPTPTLASVTFYNDVILTGTPFLRGCHFSDVYFESGFLGELEGTTEGNFAAEGFGAVVLWGPGGFDVYGHSMVVLNQTTGVAALPLKGAVTINGNATASAYNEAVDPAIWHAARALNTPSIGAQLDAAIAAGGFGNRALRPEGGTILVIP